jgi:hypothetical protein
MREPMMAVCGVAALRGKTATPLLWVYREQQPGTNELIDQMPI